MFKLNEETDAIEVDYDRIIAVSKYIINYVDEGEIKEIILPQSLCRKVGEEWRKRIDLSTN